MPHYAVGLIPNVSFWNHASQIFEGKTVCSSLDDGHAANCHEPVAWNMNRFIIWLNFHRATDQSSMKQSSFHSDHSSSRPHLLCPLKCRWSTPCIMSMQRK
jgi:hypothetical protein